MKNCIKGPSIGSVEDTLYTQELEPRGSQEGHENWEDRDGKLAACVLQRLSLQLPVCVGHIFRGEASHGFWMRVGQFEDSSGLSAMSPERTEEQS